MELSTIGEDGVPKSDHTRSLFIKLQFIICKLVWPAGVVILNILMKTFIFICQVATSKSKLK